MSALALQHELEDVVRKIGPPPTFAMPPANDNVDLPTQMHRQMAAFEENFLKWRSSMIPLLSEIRGIFVEAKRRETSSYSSLLATLRLIESAVELQIDRAPIFFPAPDEVVLRFEALGRLNPQVKKAFKFVEKKMNSCRVKFQEFLINFRDKLKIIEWDFDPDARNGVAFDKADDLISFLRS